MPVPHDDHEFERLLRETHRMVFQIAYSVLSNAADAEEVAQDAFIRAYGKRAELRDATSFRAWVARIVWRLALNRRRSWLRRLRRDGAWLGSRTWQGDAESEAQNREFSRMVRAEIDRLPDKLSQALRLSAIEGLDTVAIAEMLDIPEGTVRSRLHLARKQLLKVVAK